MIRLALLLFISFGILQAAHQSPPPFDETVSSQYFSQQYQSLPNKMESETHPTEYEAARLLKETSQNTGWSPCRISAIVMGITFYIALSYGIGFLSSWGVFHC